MPYLTCLYPENSSSKSNTRDEDMLTRFCSFETQDAVLSTRISLFHSLNGRDQQGPLSTVNTKEKSAALELNSLTRASKGARRAGELQKALNFVVRAQELDGSGTLEVAKEFAKVLWELHEESLAIQQLSQLDIVPSKQARSGPTGDQQSVLLARLVCHLASHSAEPHPLIQG